MQYVILGLLLARPMSLYDLHKAFRDQLALLYSASHGSLQRTLSELVDRGFLAVVDAPRGRRPRRLHSPTPSGIAYWHTWMLTPVSGDLETGVLSRVFFLGLLPSEERTAVIASARRQIDDALSALAAAASELDALDVSGDDVAVLHYQRRTLDYGLRGHELMRDWLDELAG